MSVVQDVATQTAVASPSVTVVGLQLMGHPVDDWLKLATLVLVVLQIVFICKRNLFERRPSSDAGEGATE